MSGPWPRKPGYPKEEWHDISIPSDCSGAGCYRLRPDGTPRAIIAKLNAELARTVKLPDVQARILNLGLNQAEDNTPEQFAAFVKADIAKYAKVIKDAGVRVE